MFIDYICLVSEMFHLCMTTSKLDNFSFYQYFTKIIVLNDFFGFKF
jgi:hypothetical protein